SLRGLRSLGEEIGLAFFGGREYFVELRSASQGREDGVILHRGVGAIVACHAALEQAQSGVLLSTKGEGGGNQVPVLGIRIGKDLRRKLFGNLLHLGGRRV